MSADALVIWPGHGSQWLTDAVIVDRLGRPNPRGRFVTGSGWEYDGGWNMPDDYRGMAVTVTVPRRWVFDWDLWPWRVVEGAGDYALALYRIERGVDRMNRAIGAALYPVMRKLARSLTRALA